jgi:hypothetical protein
LFKLAAGEKAVALSFDARWRFEPPPGEVPRALINEFSTLIGKIARQRPVQETLEHFKSYFASAAGTTSSWSSSASWAESDLDSYMSQAASNVPTFIEAFFDGCESLRRQNVGVPDVRLINRALAENDVPYRIEPPNLVAVGSGMTPVTIEHAPPSLDQQALEVLQSAITASGQFLAEGKGRQAVQELLWVLETIATAFRGLDTGTGTVQGKYFNKIVGDLRAHNPGTLLHQVLDWITTLHGFLSSPTGGGVRHGGDVAALQEMELHEARLFCNLIRSYINFLIDEHTRIVGKQVLWD